MIPNLSVSVNQKIRPQQRRKSLEAWSPNNARRVTQAFVGKEVPRRRWSVSAVADVYSNSVTAFLEEAFQKNCKTEVTETEVTQTLETEVTETEVQRPSKESTDVPAEFVPVELEAQRHVAYLKNGQRYRQDHISFRPSGDRRLTHASQDKGVPRRRWSVSAVADVLPNSVTAFQKEASQKNCETEVLETGVTETEVQRPSKESTDVPVSFVPATFAPAELKAQPPMAYLKNGQWYRQGHILCRQREPGMDSITPEESIGTPAELRRHSIGTPAELSSLPAMVLQCQEFTKGESQEFQVSSNTSQKGILKNSNELKGAPFKPVNKSSRVSTNISDSGSMHSDSSSDDSDHENASDDESEAEALQEERGDHPATGTEKSSDDANIWTDLMNTAMRIDSEQEQRASWRQLDKRQLDESEQRKRQLDRIERLVKMQKFGWNSSNHAEGISSPGCVNESTTYAVSEEAEEEKRLKSTDSKGKKMWKKIKGYVGSEEAKDAAENRVLVQQHGLSSEEIEAFRVSFLVTDTDGSGTICENELPLLMKHFGCEPTTQIQQESLATCLAVLQSSGKQLNFLGVVRFVMHYNDCCANAVSKHCASTMGQDAGIPVDQLRVCFSLVGQHGMVEINESLLEIGIDPKTLGACIEKDLFKKILAKRMTQRLREWRSTYGFKDAQIRAFKDAFQKNCEPGVDVVAFDVVPKVAVRLGYDLHDSKVGQVVLESFITSMKGQDVVSFRQFLLLLKLVENQQMKEAIKEQRDIADGIGLDEGACEELREAFQDGSNRWHTVRSTVAKLRMAQNPRQRKSLAEVAELASMQSKGMSFLQFLRILQKVAGHE